MPDLDDIWDDIIEQELYLQHEMLDHEALISKKKTSHTYSVNREVVNSKEYHDKFERLPVNKEVRQALYEYAGKLLEFVDNLPMDKAGQERLIAVAASSGKLIADNFERDGENNRTAFTEEEYARIENCRDDIILLHNHSNSDIPSATDLKTYYESDFVRLSLILGHDGTVYAIYNVRDGFLEKYDEMLIDFLQKINDKEMAKQLATTQIYRYNETLSKSKKLFDVKKF